MKTNYRWLAASLCIWLLCAWVAQQPVPVKKTRSKMPTATSAHRASARKTTHTTKSVAGKAAETVPQATTILNAQGIVADAETGLALDDNLVLVKGQCTVCHSSKLILQSHFDRDKWIERIRWMQRTQKLWDLGETEKPILDYLVAHYGPVQTPFDGRRLPLSSPTWYRL